MTPIEGGVRGDAPERDKKMRDEVNAFLEADCYAAWVWYDDNVTLGTNIEHYKRILRKMGLSKEVKPFQYCKKVALERVRHIKNPGKTIEIPKFNPEVSE